MHRQLTLNVVPHNILSPPQELHGDDGERPRRGPDRRAQWRGAPAGARPEHAQQVPVRGGGGNAVWGVMRGVMSVWDE